MLNNPKTRNATKLRLKTEWLLVFEMIQPATLIEQKAAGDKNISTYCYCVAPYGLYLLLTSGREWWTFCSY
jgi:hypothetical protein